MDHGQVAIQTDAAQKADADVNVLVEQKATELTQPLPMAPVITLKQQQMRNNAQRRNKPTQSVRIMYCLQAHRFTLRKKT